MLQISSEKKVDLEEDIKLHKQIQAQIASGQSFLALCQDKLKELNLPLGPSAQDVDHRLQMSLVI